MRRCLASFAIGESKTKSIMSHNSTHTNKAEMRENQQAAGEEVENEPFAVVSGTVRWRRCPGKVCRVM